MFSHIIFQCILCVTLDAFFFGDRLCRITCHIFPVVDIHSGFINPYVSYQLIISGVDTVQDHFYIGGFQIDHTHLSGQVVGCLVTQQRLIHIVCQKCPVFAVAKSEQIGFGIQFDLIWKFGISHIPGTVSTTADGNTAVIKRGVRAVKAVIALDLHGCLFVGLFACNAISIFRIDIDNRKFAAVDLFLCHGRSGTFQARTHCDKGIEIRTCWCITITV